MNEIEDIIIISNSLKEYKGENITVRLINSLKKYNIKKIIVVSTKDYEGVTNVLSVEDGIRLINGPFVIFDNLYPIEDDLVKYVIGSDFENKNICFTSKYSLSNKLVKSNKYGIVTNIKSKDDKKNLGYNIYANIIRVSKNILNIYKKNLQNDYFQTFINLYKSVVIEEANISYFEYDDKKDIDFKEKVPSYSLIEIDKINEIENHDDARVEELINKIKKENKWTMPIIVEKKYNMVLDGHHRLNAARKMNLKRIPAIYVNYDDIKVWTLHKEIKISHNIVVKKVIKNKEIFPYKTVKHKYPFEIENIMIELEELK